MHLAVRMNVLVVLELVMDVVETVIHPVCMVVIRHVIIFAAEVVRDVEEIGRASCRERV